MTYERQLREFTDSHQVIIADDKDPGSAWGMSHSTYILRMLQSLCADSNWSRSHLDLSGLRDLVQRTCVNALPSYLKQHAQRVAKPCQILATPALFGLTKPKCFSHSGQHLCKKPGHSCFRRVNNSRHLPLRPQWKVINRAVQGMVSLSDRAHRLMMLSIRCKAEWTSCIHVRLFVNIVEHPSRLSFSRPLTPPRLSNELR